ncbi:MAG: phage terminase large subunit family protein [Phycisphaeraceae bacterium]|nr:phage terminase large subunit family protein [Phycisphaeraceae bacterium]
MAQVLQGVANVLRPAPDVKPADWAAANISMPPEVTQRPGPVNVDIKPWGRAVLNVRADNPGKKGAIGIKPAQIGYTTAKLLQLMAGVALQPGPALYLISDRDQASFYGSDVFMAVAMATPSLRERFYRDAGARAASVKDDQTQRELLSQKPYKGGRVDFVGAGSVAKVSSRTYRDVYIDEYETFQDNWPTDKAGDGWTFAHGRTRMVAASAWIETWSHPRRKGEGIDKLYHEQSDQRHWTFCCPHAECRKRFAPRWKMVRYAVRGVGPGGDATEEGTIDPATARLHCPHCDRIITDADRAREVWAKGARVPGEGSGALVSELEPAKAATREYVGLWIHALCDPDVTVVGLAMGWASKKSVAERMAYMNVMIGEGFEESGSDITPEVLSKIIATAERVSVPGGPMGCQYMTVGVDVQAPEANPTLYVKATAWSVSGMGFTVGLVKLRGWAQLHRYLSELTVPLDDPAERGLDRPVLTAHLCAIDCGYLTGQVLDFCRTPIVHATGHHRIKLLPVRFAAHVKSTLPAVMPSEGKRTDPRRPHLGPLPLWELHRHTWVGRTISRMQNGAEAIICAVPEDYAAHATANVLMPVEDEHGWNSARMEWGKIKGRRDDWMMAGVYAEAGAALDDDLRLDRLYELGASGVLSRVERPVEDRRGGDGGFGGVGGGGWDVGGGGWLGG